MMEDDDILQDLPPEMADVGTSAPATQRLSTLLLGTCMLHWPILRTPVGQRSLKCDPCGPPIELHTFAQIFQLIELWQGTKRLSADMLRLARMPADIKPESVAKDFHAVDVVLLSPSTPTEVTFRGVSVNRQTLRHEIFAQLSHEPELGSRRLHRWLTEGLERTNDLVRQRVGAKLLEHICGDTPESELARAIIHETQAERRDVRAGFRRICELVRRPTGVVLYYFHYMPDGRAVTWPPGFHDDVLAAAKELDLPVFDPAKLITQYGAKAIYKDGRHYSPDFLPIAGNAIVDFARSVSVSESGLRRV